MGLRYVFTGSMQGYRNVMNVAASCVVRLTRHPLSQMRFLGQSFARRSPWLSGSSTRIFLGDIHRGDRTSFTRISACEETVLLPECL